jgi:hypothetical protein
MAEGEGCAYTGGGEGPAMVDVYFTCAGATYEAGGVELSWQVRRCGLGAIERRFTAVGEAVGVTFRPLMRGQGNLIVAVDDAVTYEGMVEVARTIDEPFLQVGPGWVEFVTVARPRRCTIARAPKDRWDLRASPSCRRT